jgi:hypothetical protein
MPAPRIIVVGGGCKSRHLPPRGPPGAPLMLTLISVSGLSAAHTVYLNGGNVLLLDKNSMDHVRRNKAAASDSLS